MPTGTLIILSIPVAVAVAVLAFLVLRKWFPSLRSIGSPVEQSALRRAEQAERELTLANVAIETLTLRNETLEKERSLASVIELVEKVAVGVDQTLAKLGDLNGGLRKTADALDKTNSNMDASTRAIELLASQIIIDVRGRTEP